MLNRVIASSVAVPLAVYSGEMWVGSQGRGGGFALAIACILTASIALLLWTAAFGGPSTVQATRLWRAHLITSGVAAIAYAGLQTAARAYPDSNLLGGWALMFGPLLWLAVLATAILMLPCVVTRMARL
jgi:hypothetical protein